MNATNPTTVVRRALAAYNRAKAQSRERGDSRFVADRDGTAAYLAAMPALSNRQSIQSYVACVAHGVANGIVEGETAKHLLYAAQLALAGINAGKG